MARTASALLVLLASASIALGSPLCCLIGTGCCAAGTTVEASKPKHDCCSHCKREQPGKPAPKPCDKKDCTCRHDVATHATAAEHVPLVAVFDVPAVALPERAAADVAATSHRALPLAPVRTSRPLLL
jgi:hypothetical protein